jgi:hypothetical protein
MSCLAIVVNYADKSDELHDEYIQGTLLVMLSPILRCRLVLTKCLLLVEPPHDTLRYAIFRSGENMMTSLRA